MITIMQKFAEMDSFTWQCPATIRINPKKFRVSVSPPCRLFLEPKKKKSVQSIQILQTVSMSSQRGAVGQSD